MSLHNNPKISIIVPVYNAEKYLHRCIDSILNQTFIDFEVLLINDGSTDSSGVICDEYAKKDSRIKVFHKRNGGVSSARNIGVVNMTGEYCIHCDSDDYMEYNLLEEVYSCARRHSADMVIFDYYVDFDETKQVKYAKPTSLDPLSVCKDILGTKLHGSTWNKLLKTETIKDSNLLFKESISYCEDVLFNVEFLLLQPKVKYLNKALYHYVQHDESITNRASLFQVASLSSYVLSLKELLIEKQQYQELEKFFYYQVLGVKLIFVNSGAISFSYIRRFEEESNKNLINSTLSIRGKIILLLVFLRLNLLTRILLK